MLDFKGAIIQQRFADDLENPEALFARFPDLQPSSTTFFQPVTLSWNTGRSLVCHYSITNMEHLQALPRWKWETIYQAPDIIEHGVEGAIQQSVGTEREILGVEPLTIPAGPPGFPEAVTLQLPARS